MAYDPPDDYHIGHEEDYLLFEVCPNEKNHLYILTQDECNSKVKLGQPLKDNRMPVEDMFRELSIKIEYENSLPITKSYQLIKDGNGFWDRDILKEV